MVVGCSLFCGCSVSVLGLPWSTGVALPCGVFREALPVRCGVSKLLGVCGPLGDGVGERDLEVSSDDFELNFLGSAIIEVASCLMTNSSSSDSYF